MPDTADTSTVSNSVTERDISSQWGMALCNVVAPRHSRMLQSFHFRLFFSDEPLLPYSGTNHPPLSPALFLRLQTPSIHLSTMSRDLSQGLVGMPSQIATLAGTSVAGLQTLISTQTAQLNFFTKLLQNQITDMRLETIDLKLRLPAQAMLGSSADDQGAPTSNENFDPTAPPPGFHLNAIPLAPCQLLVFNETNRDVNGAVTADTLVSAQQLSAMVNATNLTLADFYRDWNLQEAAQPTGINERPYPVLYLYKDDPADSQLNTLKGTNPETFVTDSVNNYMYSNQYNPKDFVLSLRRISDNALDGYHTAAPLTLWPANESIAAPMETTPGADNFGGSRTFTEQVQGYTFAETILFRGGATQVGAILASENESQVVVASVFSHEVYEPLADPFPSTVLWVNDGITGTQGIYYPESSDPVQGTKLQFGEDASRVTLCDYVIPAWGVPVPAGQPIPFGPFSKYQDVRHPEYIITQPFQLAKNGYATVYTTEGAPTGTGGTQIWGPGSTDTTPGGI
jgi:hypothetical protein